MGYGKSLIPSTVGFDRLLSTIEEFEKFFDQPTTKVQTYPPYNIVKESDTEYAIEIAVSGFKRDDLDITFEDGKLVVVGAIKADRTTEKFLYKGIGTRSFTHKFTLADTIVIKKADIVDGLLVISLENIIPEEKKPRKILIGNDKKPLLT